MTRLYGRSHGGERVVDYVPDVRFERFSVLSSIRLNGEMIPMSYDGTLNGELFQSYIKEFLCPHLTKDDILIMDNLPVHKVKGVIESIESIGAKVMFLPPYSPDLNPIELLWSKIKACIKKIRPTSKKELTDALKVAFDTITLDDISGWFSHCSYSLC